MEFAFGVWGAENKESAAKVIPVGLQRDHDVMNLGRKSG